MIQVHFQVLCEVYLESIIFLAASAYLNRSLRASSLYLIRDNLKKTPHSAQIIQITPAQTVRTNRILSNPGWLLPYRDVIHDLSEHRGRDDGVTVAR